MNIKANGIIFNASRRPGRCAWLVFSNSLATILDVGRSGGVSSKEYRVMRYDQRGPVPPKRPPPYTFDLLVADVIALFDAQNRRRTSPAFRWAA